MTKQSQRNIQIVKVQVGDLRRKRKAKKKTKGKKRSEVFSGTGLAPVLGQAFIPPMFPTSRMGTQFEAPRLQVIEPKKEEPLKDVQSLELLKKVLEERARALSKAPQDWSASSSSSSSRLEEPPKPMDKPRSPLVSAEAASSSSDVESNFNLTKPFTRADLRQLTFKQLNKIRKQLGLGLPDPVMSSENAGITAKENLIEILVGYRPSL